MSDVANAVFQVVWPIVDSTVPLADLYDEAAGKLQRLADRANAIITGPPVWRVAPAADVVGWEAYAPGLVLIGAAPAEDGRAAPQRIHDIDPVEVGTALLRNELPRRPADRAEMVRILYDTECRDYATITARTGLQHDAINQILVRLKRRGRRAVRHG